MRRVWGLTMAAVLLVALAGTACGESKASAETIVRGAPAKTQKAKTARLAMVADTTAGSNAVHVTADGVIDLAGHKADMTMDVGQALPGKIRMLLVGLTAYLQLPSELASQVPGGKPFVKVDLQQAAKQQGFDLGAIQQNADATAQLDYLRGVSNDVHEVGHDTLRGTSTTHYAGTVDLKKAAATAATPEAKQSIERAEQVLGTSTFPVDVWIDGQGRLRKMAYKMDLSKSATGGGQAALGQ